MRNDNVTKAVNVRSVPRSEAAVRSQGIPFQKLDVYRASRELAALVHRLDVRDAELRDQATRAAKSTFLNLCEGLPDDRGAMRRKYFAQADGSLHETAGAVDLAAAIGAVPQERADAVLVLAGRVRAMIKGLIRAGKVP